MRRVKIGLLFLTLTACSPKKHNLEVNEWMGTGIAPQWVEKGFLVGQETKLSDRSVLLKSQEFQGANVLDTFSKKLINSQGELVYYSLTQLTGFPTELSAQVVHMRDKKAMAIPLLNKTNPEIVRKGLEPEVEVVVLPSKDSATEDAARALWKVKSITDDGVFSYLIDEQGQVIQTRKESTGFHGEVSAYLFPEGPKRSVLDEVLLHSLRGDGTLATNQFQVVTQSYNSVDTRSGQLRFDPEDEKFEQVQVFYFVSRAMDWFNQTLGVQLPFQLRVTVHFGYPEKRSAAFYERGHIRLGSGDDVSWSKMPLDPSIVIHETVHALVEAVANLPTQGEGGSLNEAFADFFTCLQLRSPLLGDLAYRKAAYRRTLENNFSKHERTGGLYADSLIVSGLLWELRSLVGEDAVRDLAMDTLLMLHPGSHFDDFADKLKLTIQKNLFGEYQLEALKILQRRGW